MAVEVAVVVVAILALGIAAPRRPRVAVLTLVALLAAPMTSEYFAGDRGPVTRGVWIVGPLVWVALATLVAGPGIDALAARAPRGVRVVTGVAVIAIGIASLLSGRARYPSRDSLWKAALAIDPGNESAALAVAAADRAAHAPAAALDVLLGCTRAHATSCACAEAGASAAIDLARYADARHVLDGSHVCPETPRRMGLEAEALVGTPGNVDEGLREAGRALELEADELHAIFARAWGTALKGRASAALPDARRAVALGRGVPAELLYGRVLFQNGDLIGADAQFVHVLMEDPTNFEATYDHALVCDRQKRYDDAHDGYLRALALDPSNADARYAMVVLSHAHGAPIEARHNLDELAARHPDDERLPALRQLVARPVATH